MVIFVRLKSPTLRTAALAVATMLPASIAFAKAKKPDPFLECVAAEKAKDRKEAEASAAREAENKSLERKAKYALVKALRESETCTAVDYYTGGRHKPLGNYYVRLDDPRPILPQEGIQCTTTHRFGDGTIKRGTIIISPESIGKAESDSDTLTIHEPEKKDTTTPTFNVIRFNEMVFLLAPNPDEGNRLIPRYVPSVSFTFANAELAANARDAFDDFVGVRRRIYERSSFDDWIFSTPEQRCSRFKQPAQKPIPDAEHRNSYVSPPVSGMEEPLRH